MTIPSNLYAEKIFAEHPLALWSLDEKADYISKITESVRESGPVVFSSSDSVGVDEIDDEITALDLVGAPFPDSKISKIKATTSNDALIETMRTYFNAQIPSSRILEQLKTFTISVYIKAPHSYTTGIELGYCTINGDNAARTIKATQTFSAPMPGSWSMYSATFDVPLFSSTEDFIAPVIFFKYVNQVVATQQSGSYNYSYLVNGLTVGQWSEEFNATSLGVELGPSNLFMSGSSPDPLTFMAEAFVPGYQYGMGSDDAKYIVCNNTLLAKNTSIPMVYGSGSLTKLIPHPVSGYPSLILPGQGALHPSGRYNLYTFEAWMRIDNRSNAPRRILGPVFSDYGLYVDGPFLRLKIGTGIASYYVGEWYRPMLVDIRIAIDSATLLINGEEVISIDFKTADLELSNLNYANYWGFYAYQDVPVVEIDVPAVYSYIVPGIMAKRRFGYAQAVESPDGANKAFGASTAFIDYSVADYTNNYHYPDIGRWEQGIQENIDVSDNTLSSPSLSLPDFVFQDDTYSEWFGNQVALEDFDNGAYFSFEDSPGFVRFNSLSVASQETKAAYLIFGINEFIDEEQNLLKIVNRLSNDHVRVSLSGDVVSYYIKIRGIEELFHQEIGVVIGAKIFVGISFSQFASVFGGDVQSFFSRSNQLTMLVAGDSSFEKMFTGKIYKVGLCTERNLNKISQLFSITEIMDEADSGVPSSIAWFEVIDGGTPYSFETSTVYDHIATYTLAASYDYEIYEIDVDSDSYWQDYLPLSYFSQYVRNTFGQSYYDLDFIQINLDYPTIPKFSAGTYDTSDYFVKTYVSFQPISSGANKQLSSFSNVLAASQNGVVTPSREDDSFEWIDTAYEVVDGMIIYPPSNISFDEVAIVTHIEISAKKSINNKINIRRLQYASQAFNSDTANPIGTKFNVPIYPYQKFFAFFDYKSRNPYKIYKGSTPHLYLTKKTGIEKVGDYDQLINRGFLININDKAAPEYRVMAAQMFLYYDRDFFPLENVKIFEIQSGGEYIKFFMNPTDSSGKRAKIRAVVASTGATKDGVAYFINGKIVKDPVINVEEWTSLGIQFAEPIVFDNSVGAIRFTAPLLVNNISYYESSSLQEVERQAYRLWDEVAANAKTWQYWRDLISNLGQSYSWKDVLVIASSFYSGVSPKDTYQSHTGTNKIIADDGTQFYLGGTSFKTINGTSWSQTSTKPL